MRAGSVLSEAWRDLVTGTTRAALLAAVLAALVCALALADAHAVADVLARADAFRGSGAAVQLLDANRRIDGAACESLGHAGGIDAAGAVRQGHELTALALPSSRLTVWDVTPGLLGVLRTATPVAAGSDSRAGGVWLAADLATTLGVAPGDDLATTTGPVHVSGVYTWPDDGRDRTLGYTVLAPTPATGAFDRCLASIWPTDDDTTALLYLALDGNADQVKHGQLNTSLGTTLDVPALLAVRATRWATLAAAVAGLLIGLAAGRARRLEVAAALHSRVPRPHLAWSHALQALAWSAAAGLVVLAATAWYARSTGAFDDVWPTALRTVAAGVLTPTLGVLLAVLTTREARLFRYFKER